MIRLLLDPPRFECTTQSDVRLLRLKLVPGSPPVILLTKPANPSRAILRPGKIKPCRKCGASFRVVSRADCACYTCYNCRKVSKPRPRKAKPALSVVPPTPAPTHCACGLLLISGVCSECTPLRAWA